MTISPRYIVAAVLLVFAWRGNILDVSWPSAPKATSQTPRPSADLLAHAEPLRAILPQMLPKDRAYLSAFYDAMSLVLLRDGERADPIIGTTDQFSGFHAGSLRLAIDKSAVGKYPGLAEAIDKTIASIAGEESRKMDSDLRKRFIAACCVLAWSLGIAGDG